MSSTPQSPRRFVLSADGLTLDGPAPAVYPLPQAGATLVDLWRSDVVPLDNAAPGDPTVQGEFALMPGGALFRYVVIDPTGDGEPMWHQTPSTDFSWILSGDATLRWPGGQTVLRAGDACVVRGGEHAWANLTDQPVCLVTVAVAAVSN